MEQIMKIAKEIAIIMGITLISEYLNKALPLPIPAGVYGMVILLVCLVAGAVKLESVETSGNKLVELMPIMFIPAGVGLINYVAEIRQYLVPLVTVTVVSTVVVMGVTGRTAEFILKKRKKEK